jgi:hypothetical protein
LSAVLTTRGGVTGTRPLTPVAATVGASTAGASTAGAQKGEEQHVSEAAVHSKLAP